MNIDGCFSKNSNTDYMDDMDSLASESSAVLD